MPRPIDNTDITWLHDYEAATRNHFEPRFGAYQPRFSQGADLLERYSSAIREVIVQGRHHFHAVDEAHNEICVADAILSDPSTAKASLLYEPPLPNTDKTIDFAVRECDGRLTLVDVKTIKPQSRDRWDQYERAVKEGWIPKNVQFILERDWQGGEIWHTAFASRSRFLEYSLELEAKLSAAAYGESARRRVLILCGEGFHWHQSELEDFVAYYRTGVHREDDPFSCAEERSVQANKLVFERSISSFACLDRRQGEVAARRINWCVQAPKSPFGLSSAT